MKYNYSEDSYKRILEAQERGRKTTEAKISKIREIYNLSPSLCLKCKNPIPYLKRTYKFCSRSCSAAHSNANRRIHGKDSVKRKCKNCFKDIVNKSFCTRKCSGLFKIKQTYDKIANGKYHAKYNTKNLKNFLKYQRGNKCEKCNLNNWLGVPINLTLHHEDGNARNNIPENLRLYCWNCHSMTENFGSKNKNSTRTYRYK